MCLYSDYFQMESGGRITSGLIPFVQARHDEQRQQRPDDDAGPANQLKASPGGQDVAQYQIANYASYAGDETDALNAQRS